MFKLIILGITSLVCSRAMFSFINDPEGPNLLVVIVMALILYSISLAVYLRKFSAKLTSSKRVLLAILIQVVSASTFYFLMK